MRLFLYGTLLDARTLASRGGQAGAASRFVPASLPGWQRVALRNGRYPTLRRHRTGVVHGALFVAPARMLARLTAYEGSDYRLTRVVVRTTNGKTAAHTWIAPGGTRLPWMTRGS
jgi:gamma-glutamylcyclotransferase (GGCT)/AIG2-like uncharacterized protein YtfP